MRVAALADVHGNLPALEAVLAEIRAEEVEQLVVCGDVASGPMPAETIDALMRLPAARFVQGNADRGLVAAFDREPLPAWPGPRAAGGAARIERRHRDFLASFAQTIRLEGQGLGRVLFCHGSPRSDEEMMTERTPDERLRAYLAGVDADVVVCGHTHMQFDLTVAGVRVVNAGSVGMPYGTPGAFWALLGQDVELRRTEYDRDAAGARIRAAAGADAEEFVRENVLSVPSAEEAFAFFASQGGP